MTTIENQHTMLCNSYASGVLTTEAQRISVLHRFETAVFANRQLLLDALFKDLHKSPQQATVTEYNLVLHELAFFIENLHKLMQRRMEPVTPATLNARLYTQFEPLGPTLIVVPFNYPLQLALVPLIGCLAAGNVALVKFSRVSFNTRAAVIKTISDAGMQSLVQVHDGPNDELFSVSWKMVFFTGSTEVGRGVYQKAAAQLAKVVLELGGANPCLVDGSADLDMSARQVAFGKLNNAGQTCIAPNAVCFSGSDEHYSRFLALLTLQFERFRGDYQHLCRLSTPEKFDQLLDGLKHGSVVECALERGERLEGTALFEAIAAQKETGLFPPTIIEVAADCPLLKKELFGPILPIYRLPFTEFMSRYQKSEKESLAAYLFTKNKKQIAEFKQAVVAGAVSINQVIMYVTSSLPFGGIGASGLGAYHGKHSFAAFSHMKPICEIGTGILASGMNNFMTKVGFIPYMEQNGKLMQKLMFKPINIKNWIVLFFIMMLMFWLVKK